MSIILESVFVFSFLVLVLQLHKGLLAFMGEDYAWPFLGKNIFVVYPSLMYQIYFWAKHLNVL